MGIVYFGSPRHQRGVVVNARNISQKKRAEEALQRTAVHHDLGQAAIRLPECHYHCRENSTKVHKGLLILFFRK